MARWLFLILVVLNGLLILWGYRHPPVGAGSPPEIPAGVPSLRLISEQEVVAAGPDREQFPVGDDISEPEKTVPEVESPQQPGTQTSGTPLSSTETRCIRLGPLRDQAEAMGLIVQVAKAGLEAELVIEAEQRQSGYWVLIPPGEEEVDFVVANLELAGIHDVWRFSKGELAGYISLGLYSDETLARKRLEELSAKDFRGEIRPRTIDESRYWVAITHPQDQEAADQFIEEVFTQHPAFAYPPPQCGTIASSGGIP